MRTSTILWTARVVLAAFALAGCTSPRGDAAGPDEPAASASDIAGTVTDEFGVPFPCTVGWRSSSGVESSVPTDDAGAFRLSGIADGAIGAVSVRIDTVRAVSVQPVCAGATGVHVVANRARAPIAGRVIGADGAPVTRNWVMFRPVDPPLAPFARQDGRSTKLGADGSFTIPAATGALYELALDLGHGRFVLGNARAGDTGVVLRVPPGR